MKFYKIFKFNKNNIPRNDSLIISINPVLYHEICLFFKENLNKPRYWKLFSENFIYLYYIHYINCSYRNGTTIADSLLIHLKCSRRYITTLKSELKRLRLIDYSLIKEENSTRFKPSVYSRITLPVENVIETCNRSKSYKDYIDIEYNNIDKHVTDSVMRYFNTIKAANKSNNLSNKYANLRIKIPEDVHLVDTSYGLMSVNSYNDMINNIFINETPKINDKDSRIYSLFHRLPKKYRKYLFYKGAPLVEFGDIPCSHWLCLSVLIKHSDIPQTEKDYFTSLVINLSHTNGFYGKILEWINEDEKFTRRYDRESLKHYLLMFMNYDRKKLNSIYNGKLSSESTHVLKKIYDIFNDKFPNLLKFIMSIPNSGDDSIHNRLSRIETNIITSLIKTYEETYHIDDLISLHDSIWCTEHTLNILKDADFNKDCINFVMNL